MSILVTGCAGFIGYHVCRRLQEEGETVVGIDSLNAYYDVTLKKTRLGQLQAHKNFIFIQEDISQPTLIDKLSEQTRGINYIIHLAAQAGVRYSLENPFAYGSANLMGQIVMLELARRCSNLKHFVYASSSSVYGANTKLPFAIEDPVDAPISLYAATKRSGELMGYCYSHLFNLPTTGLRFFTVYGPWGRPDMSAFIFTKAILEGAPMPVFNHGKMRRNFTYIEDIVAGTVACMRSLPAAGQPLQRLYNVGNNRSEDLMDFINTLESLIGKKANIAWQPMQPGDVRETIADITASTQDFGFHPQTNIKDGLQNFVDWYKEYYGY